MGCPNDISNVATTLVTSLTTETVRSRKIQTKDTMTVVQAIKKQVNQ